MPRMRWFACLGSIANMVLAAACAAPLSRDADEATLREDADLRANAPAESFIGPTGTRFRLVGPAQMRSIPPVHDSSHNAATTERTSASFTRAELAEALRPVTFVDGYEYIGEEPAYELADATLNDGVIGQDTEGRELRGLVGPPCSDGEVGTHCDNRLGTFSPQLPFHTPNLFNEAGCTATMIDRGTAVTAAHCVFGHGNGGAGYWIVADGNSCRSSSESASNVTEDRRGPISGSSTTQNCLPRYGAGLTQNGAQIGWYGCYNVTIPNAWRTATETSFAGRRWDFAVLNFYTSGCGFANPGDATGWRGTLIATTSQLSANRVAVWGYPGIADPFGSNDDPFNPALRQWTPVENCGGYSLLPGTEQLSITPCATALLLGMDELAAYMINPTGLGTWQLGSTVIDVSPGQSGAGIILQITNPSGTKSAPRDPMAHYLIGIHSGNDDGTFQLARRWDSELRSFVASNSSFPRTN